MNEKQDSMMVPPEVEPASKGFDILEEPQSELLLDTSEVDLAMAPYVRWVCPKCGKRRESFKRMLIEPIGQRVVVPWRCDCGHEGLLKRSTKIMVAQGLPRAARRAAARKR